MATQIIKSVGATGRDYATIQAACAAIPLDLIAADENWIFELYNDAEFNFVGENYLSSGNGTPRTITADATRTVTFKAATGQGFGDHANKLTNPLRYNPAAGAAARVGGGWSTGGLYLDIPYSSVEGLQFKSHEGSQFVLWGSATETKIKKCLIEGFNCSQVAVKLQLGARLLNSVVAITGTTAPSGAVMFTGQGGGVGNTIWCESTAQTRAFYNNYGAGTGITVKNNVAVGVSFFMFDYNANTTGTMWSGGTYSHNASTTTIPVGTSNLESLTGSDQFVNIASAATLDLRPKAGNSLQAGVTDALLGGVDILGQTRASPPTIGAMEYVVAGPSTSLTATLGDTLGGIISKAPPKTDISANSANLLSSHTSGTGSATSVEAVVLSGNFSFFSSGSVSGGTFTSDVLRDNQGAGSIIANKSFVHVTLYDNSTGALVVRKTGISTNGSGVFSFTDAAIIPGATYKVDWEDVDGRLRMPRKVAT